MITIIIKNNRKTIYKKEIGNFDNAMIENIIDEINKSIDIGKKFTEAKSEYNKEAVKQMVGDLE
ncbi:MAG: hypothetical protein RXO36_05340 [Candidatus Nanopusillus acidilobi]